MFKRLIAGASAVLVAASSAVFFPGDNAITASAETTLEFALSVPGSVAVAGDTSDGTETVTVNIELGGNEGVQSWVLLLDYDTTKVSFDSISSDTFCGISVSDKNGRITINDFESRDVYTNGTAASLTFKVNQGLAKGSYDCFELALSPDPDNFFNYADQRLAASVTTSKARLNLDSRIPVQGVEFTVGAVTIDAGSSVTPTYNILPANANNTNVNFTTSDASVAIVNKQGKITALSPGECVITVTTQDGGYTAQLSVTVRAASADTVYIPANMTTGTTGEIDLSSYGLTQSIIGMMTASSSNAAVAEAEIYGSILRIYAYSPGVTSIKCTAPGVSNSVVINVTVTDSANNGPTVSFAQDQLTLKAGEARTLELMVTPADYPDAASFTDITRWSVSSSDESIVRTDVITDSTGTEYPTGKITAMRSGTAVITALNPDYIDSTGKMIPVICNVKVVRSTGITADIKAKNAPAGTGFTVTLVKNGTTVAENTVNEFGTRIFSGVDDGDYTALIVCSDPAYAQKETAVTVSGGEAVIEEELYLCGDTDGNGRISLEDISRLQQYLSGWNVTLPYKEVGNVDGSADGKVSSSDIARFQQYMSGWNVKIGRV